MPRREGKIGEIIARQEGGFNGARRARDEKEEAGEILLSGLDPFVDDGERNGRLTQHVK